MQYMLLIYEPENEAKPNELLGDCTQLTADIRATGHYRAGDALRPTVTATTVRVRDGKTHTIDGPFAETRDQLAGYYLIEAKDLDEAIRIAARIPSARVGCIEIRPVMRSLA